MLAKDALRQSVGELLDRTLPRGLPPNWPVERPLVDAGLDSVAVLQLVAALEERFEITLAETDLTAENMATLGSIVRLLRRRTEP